MTPEEIRKGAPDGATHYAIFLGTPIYYKSISGVRYVWHGVYKGWDVPLSYALNIKPLP